MCAGITGETVAVKSVDASNFRSIAQIDQIQDEISVLSGLKHPSIIRLLDMHFTNNIFYFVMEYAAGGCLVDYVKTQVRQTTLTWLLMPASAQQCNCIS